MLTSVVMRKVSQIDRFKKDKNIVVNRESSRKWGFALWL